MWTLLPLGNPGPDYAGTRHNLGRLMLLRWLEDHSLQPKVRKTFGTGTLYGLTKGLEALVPATYMNLSGQVLQEAVAAGMDPTRMVALHDDKDLPLGLGRFRLSGSAGGHNGMQSLLEALGTEDLTRLRLGIGPFTRPLHEFVLGTWTEPEQEVLARMDSPFAAFLDRLGQCGELEELPAKVNGPDFWQGNNQTPGTQA